MRQIRTRYAYAIGLLGVLLQGCSPHLFFSDGLDPKIQNTQNYRTVNVGCRGLELNSRVLSVTQLRELIACLNSENRLLGVGAFLLSLTDDELRPFAHFLNQELFSRSDRLYELEHSYLAWEAKGLVGTLIADLGLFLKHETVWTRSFGLLRSAIDGERVNRELLSVLSVVGREISPASVGRGLDVLQVVAGHPAVADIRERMRDPWSVDEVRRSVNALWSWLEFDPDLLKLVGDGRVTRVIRNIVAESRVSGLEVLLRRLLQGDGERFLRLSRLAEALEGSIECFAGGTSIPNARQWALRELLDYRSSVEARRAFLARDMPLMMSGLSIACRYPEGVTQSFSALAELTETESFEPLMNLLDAVHVDPELESAFFKILGSPQTRALVRTLQAFSERDLIRPMLSIVSSLPDETLHWLESAAQVLLQKTDERRESRTIYEVLGVLLKKNDSDDFADWVLSFESFFLDDKWTVSSVFDRLREAFYSTNRYPFTQILKALLRESAQYEGVIRVAVGFTDQARFVSAFRDLRLLAENGTLASTLRSLVRLFHARATEGFDGLAKVTRVPDRLAVLHHRRSSDFSWIEMERVQNADLWDRCRDHPLTVNGTLLRPLDSFFESWRRCGQMSSWVKTEDIFEPWTAASSPSGSSVLSEILLASSRISSRLDRQELQAIVESALDGLDSPEVDSLLGLFEALEIRDLSKLTSRVLGQWSLVPSAASEFFGWMAARLRDDAFPGFVAFLKQIVNSVEPLPREPVDKFWDDRLRAEGIAYEIERRECRSIPFASGSEARSLWLTTRAKQLWYNFALAASNNELKTDRSARRIWSTQELHQCLGAGIKGEVDLTDPIAFCKEPFIEALADRSVVHALLRSLQSQSGDDLYRWLDTRAKDTQVISYYFPGARAPQAKVVNSLDLFETILLNADIDLTKMIEMPLIGGMLESSFGLKANMALHFLGLLGDAWGDEPRELWPDAIRAKYQRENPLTLRQAYQKIREQYLVLVNLMGLPDADLCEFPTEIGRNRLPNWLINALNQQGISAEEMRSRLFNIGQALPVIENNLPDSSHPQAGGMRLLRRLFFELAYATAPEFRSPKGLWRNRLSLVIRLVRMGLTRQVGRVLYRKPSGDPEIARLISALVELSKNPALPGLLHAVVPAEPRYQESLYAQTLEAVSAGLEKRSTRGAIQELAADIASITGQTVLHVGHAAVADSLRAMSDWVANFGDTTAAWMPAALEESWENENVVSFVNEFEEALSQGSADPSVLDFLGRVLKDRSVWAALGPLMEAWVRYQDDWVAAYRAMVDSDEWREFDGLGFFSSVLESFANEHLAFREALADEIQGPLPLTTLHFFRRHPARANHFFDELQTRIESGDVRALLDLTIRSLQNTRDEQR